MEKLRDWAVLRKELKGKTDKETVNRFDSYLAKGLIVHAIRLLRENGIAVHD